MAVPPWTASGVTFGDTLLAGEGFGERGDRWLHFETAKDSIPSKIKGLVFRGVIYLTPTENQV